MSTLKTIHDFPAYKVVEARTIYNETVDAWVKQIKTGVMIYVNDRRYIPNSVMNYAIENNECPLAAYADAKEKGHTIYWLNPLAISLSSRKSEKKTVWGGYEIGDYVHFQGKLFVLDEAPNGNLNLNIVEA